MGRKKAKRQEATPTRPKGKSRARVVLSIVATDNTFYQLQHPEQKFTQIQPWVGKCIHCNTKFFVSHTGETDATVEHIRPLCDGGDPTDPRNLALACKRCNNEKGIRHDQHSGKGGRADDVIAALMEKRMQRWREPVQVPDLPW